MNNRNILYVHNGNFNFIGANKLQVMNMCNAFAEANCDVSLVGFGNLDFINETYYFSSKVQFKLLNTSLNYYFRTIKLVLNTLNVKDYDLIFTRDLVYTFFIKLFNSKSNIIYELHEIKTNHIWKLMFKLVFGRINNLVVISNGLKNKLVEIGYDSNKIKVLHDGVDLNKFNINLSQKQTRIKLNLPFDKKVVLYIGSFQDWKGYETFLKASKLNLNSNIIYYCIGGTETQITELASQYPNVEFNSFVDSNLVPFWLKSADVLVIPNSGKTNISKYYTSPLKLFEYMASKTPVVASDLPSIRDVVTDKDVMFFESDNVGDLSNKIHNLLNDNSLNKLLYTNSFEKVKNYTWEKRVEDILNLK
jgi:glycosyltransferase involved in cell wall biosynthesis